MVACRVVKALWEDWGKDAGLAGGNVGLYTVRSSSALCTSCLIAPDHKRSRALFRCLTFDFARTQTPGQRPPSGRGTRAPEVSLHPGLQQFVQKPLQAPLSPPTRLQDRLARRCTSSGRGGARDREEECRGRASEQAARVPLRAGNGRPGQSRPKDAARRHRHVGNSQRLRHYLASPALLRPGWVGRPRARLWRRRRQSGRRWSRVAARGAGAIKVWPLSGE